MMNRFLLIMAGCLLMAAGRIYAQTDMTLTERQQALVAVAACEAKGDIEGLKNALHRGLDQGLTVSEAKEALSQLYAYTGFPRSLNALGALQQVLQVRQSERRRTDAGREADPLPHDYDALVLGTQVQTQLTGRPFSYDFAPQTDYYLKAHLFGDIFARNNLSFADREIVTISAISALAGCEPQLKAHVAGARNMGVSIQQLCDIPQVLAERVEHEEAVRAVKAINEVCGTAISLSVVGELPATPWPKGNPNDAYAQFFTGNSYLAPMGPVANVTFEPRCRNNWHVHHGAVQVLICVSGRGWYQEWGKEAIEMTPGSVIAIPAEAKHWHGAARDSWFQHLTFHTDVEKGASNEWLEPVSDEVYDKLK